jgi:hypothetical protein
MRSKETMLEALKRYVERQHQGTQRRSAAHAR